MTDAERYAISVQKVVVDGQELWRATVRELPDLADFAETREEAIELALDSIESLKASAVEEGRPFPEPLEDEEEYSGRVTFRLSKSMHRQAAIRAESEGVSLNTYIVECVANRLGALVSNQTPSTDVAQFGRPWAYGSDVSLGTNFDLYEQMATSAYRTAPVSILMITSTDTPVTERDVETQFAISPAHQLAAAHMKTMRGR